MKLMRQLLFVLLLLPLFLRAQSLPVWATSQPDDSLQVSFLTCAPGHELHRLYGHTAIRFNEPKAAHGDWTYDYGWFSFKTPNFVMKFILGLTDYSMAKESTPLFVAMQLSDDVPIMEQKLNLKPAEIATLRAHLDRVMNESKVKVREFPTQGVDGKPDTLRQYSPDWTYRYNFLYDNCTTRAVHAIEQALKVHGATIEYPAVAGSTRTLTQREMIHEFTHHSPWYEFGQDLLLGTEVDQQHTLQAMTRLNFLPTYAANFFSEARIKDADGSFRPLVKATSPRLPITPQPKRAALPFGPTVTFWCLFGLGVLLTFGQWQSRHKDAAHQRAWRIWTASYDFLHFEVMGLVGVLLTLMVGWSEHPAVGENWLLSIFNPFLLIVGIYLIVCLRRGRRNYLALALPIGVAVYLAVYISGHQHFPAGTLPLALTLLMRGIAIYLQRPSAKPQHI